MAEIAGVRAPVPVVRFDKLSVGGRFPAIGDVRQILEGLPPPGFRIAAGQT
jgi:hypothetical protein